MTNVANFQMSTKFDKMELKAKLTFADLHNIELGGLTEYNCNKFL